MKRQFDAMLEAGRFRDGHYGSSPGVTYGAFNIMGPCGEWLLIIACDGEPPESEGWEHVSVSTRRRIPNWLEMSFVKDLFWKPEECVVQFHPPRSEYVNNHPNVLHLWRHTSLMFPMPPSILVGHKDRGVLTKEETHRIAKDMS